MRDELPTAPPRLTCAFWAQSSDSRWAMLSQYQGVFFHLLGTPAKPTRPEFPGGTEPIFDLLDQAAHACLYRSDRQLSCRLAYRPQIATLERRCIPRRSEYI